MGDNCPTGCKHSSFHFCDDSGTHCDKHCVCTCSQCVQDRKDPAPRDPETGGVILSGSIIVHSK